jgi:hypothetical protein
MSVSRISVLDALYQLSINKPVHTKTQLYKNINLDSYTVHTYLKNNIHWVDGIKSKNSIITRLPYSGGDSELNKYIQNLVITALQKMYSNTEFVQYLVLGTYVNYYSV